MRQTFAIIFLGAVAGAILITIITGSLLDNLYREKEELKLDLFETTDRLHKVESLLATHQEGTILTVSINLDSEENAFIQLELKKMINEIVSSVVGSQIDSTEPELIISLLQGRRLTVEKNDYLVNVNWIAIAQNTVFDLSVEKAES